MNSEKLYRCTLSITKTLLMTKTDTNMDLIVKSPTTDNYNKYNDELFYFKCTKNTTGDTNVDLFVPHTRTYVNCKLSEIIQCNLKLVFTA